MSGASEVPAIPADVRKLATETAMSLGLTLNLEYDVRQIARAIMADRASRLLRQEDETRKAALEEAAEVARDVEVCWEAPNGWSIKELTGMVLACRIRALSQKGDEVDG